jgi:hypothetical protein
MKYSRVKMVCAECGKDIMVKKYLAEKPTKHGRFCSPTCRSKYYSRINPACQKNRIVTHCALCNKMLELEPHRILERNFCSNSCRGKYGLQLRWPDGAGRKTITCSFCGKVNEVPKEEFASHKKRKQRRFFCDRKCFAGWKAANWIGENNPSWKGGWTPHGKGWVAACEIVRYEQDYKCADCGITEDEIGKHLDIHHLRPARLFNTKREAATRSNLIGLCHKCHMAREYA